MRPSLLLLLLSILSSALPAAAAPDEPTPIFDAKSFSGWEGDTKITWHIEDGAIVAGSLDRKQVQNDFLATVKEYANFDLTLKYKLEGKEGFINGGVQFRSRRVPHSPEVSGYQADLGMGYDGALYDESRRNKVLARPPQDLLEKIVKPLGEWNDYHIRAEGRRIQIWLNGVQTCDYTEMDESLPQTGIIALQIHGNAVSVVRYKDIQIRELLPAPATGSTIAHANNLAGNSKLPLNKDEVIGLVGGEDLVAIAEDGSFELSCLRSHPGDHVHFRSLAWEGDTVFEQRRDLNYPSLVQQLDDAGATAVIVMFGKMESLSGADALPLFRAAYSALLDRISGSGKRKIVMLSPTPFEAWGRTDVLARNRVLSKYVAVCASIAAQRGATYIDLYSPTAANSGGTRKTRDGVHLLPAAISALAKECGSALWLPDQATRNTAAEDKICSLIAEKNLIWFNYYRPQNWAFLAGDRTNQPSSRDYKDPSKRWFPAEMKEWLPLMAEKEAEITQEAANLLAR